MSHTHAPLPRIPQRRRTGRPSAPATSFVTLGFPFFASSPASWPLYSRRQFFFSLLTRSPRATRRAALLPVMRVLSAPPSFAAHCRRLHPFLFFQFARRYKRSTPARRDIDIAVAMAVRLTSLGVARAQTKRHDWHLSAELIGKNILPGHLSPPLRTAPARAP